MKCPHCGNTDRNLMEDNGASDRAVDLALICTVRVKLGDDSFDGKANPPLEVGPDGLVICGMLWSPNDCQKLTS